MIGLAYPEVSPIIFSIGTLSVRWYSMAYLAGILLGWWLVSCRVKKYDIGLNRENLEDLVFYVTLGIILGGRLGYILFYGQGTYLENPLEIWHGGMSFHGGIIGVIIALLLAARKLKFSFLKITDLVASVTPIGIFLGRLANFVNDELSKKFTPATKLTKNNNWLFHKALNEWDYEKDEVYAVVCADSKYAKDGIFIFTVIMGENDFLWCAYSVKEEDLNNIDDLFK